MNMTKLKFRSKRRELESGEISVLTSEGVSRACLNRLGQREDFFLNWIRDGEDKLGLTRKLGRSNARISIGIASEGKTVKGVLIQERGDTTQADRELRQLMGFPVDEEDPSLQTDYHGQLKVDQDDLLIIDPQHLINKTDPAEAQYARKAFGVDVSFKKGALIFFVHDAEGTVGLFLQAK